MLSIIPMQGTVRMTAAATRAMVRMAAQIMMTAVMKMAVMATVQTITAQVTMIV